MSYSDFTALQQLSKKFGIRSEKTDFIAFDNITLKHASERCLLDILESRRIPSSTEKAKSEMMITPILRELMRQTDWRFNIFSGFSFDVDAANGLNGVCDYLLSSDITAAEVAAPIFCVVEAKNRGIEEGIAQAGAELYAAQIFNEAEGTPTPILYGCVTNAFDWLFLRLEHKTLYIDTKRYYIDEATLPKLLGILCFIVEKHTKTVI
jgi:hypothetical protein